MLQSDSESGTAQGGVEPYTESSVYDELCDSEKDMSHLWSYLVSGGGCGGGQPPTAQCLPAQMPLLPDGVGAEGIVGAEKEVRSGRVCCFCGPVRPSSST